MYNTVLPWSYANNHTYNQLTFRYQSQNLVHRFCMNLFCKCYCLTACLNPYFCHASLFDSVHSFQSSLEKIRPGEWDGGVETMRERTRSLKHISCYLHIIWVLDSSSMLPHGHLSSTSSPISLVLMVGWDQFKDRGLCMESPIRQFDWSCKEELLIASELSLIALLSTWCFEFLIDISYDLDRISWWIN